MLGHTHARYGIKSAHTGWQASVIEDTVSFPDAAGLAFKTEVAAISRYIYMAVVVGGRGRMLYMIMIICVCVCACVRERERDG